MVSIGILRPQHLDLGTQLIKGLNMRAGSARGRNTSYLHEQGVPKPEREVRIDTSKPDFAGFGTQRPTIRCIPAMRWHEILTNKLFLVVVDRNQDFEAFQQTNGYFLFILAPHHHLETPRTVVPQLPLVAEVLGVVVCNSRPEP